MSKNHIGMKKNKLLAIWHLIRARNFFVVADRHVHSRATGVKGQIVILVAAKESAKTADRVVRVVREMKKFTDLLPTKKAKDDFDKLFHNAIKKESKWD